jgi:hypothetical protein
MEDTHRYAPLLKRMMVPVSAAMPLKPAPSSLFTGAQSPFVAACGAAQPRIPASGAKPWTLHDPAGKRTFAAVAAQQWAAQPATRPWQRFANRIFA